MPHTIRITGNGVNAIISSQHDKFEFAGFRVEFLDDVSPVAPAVLHEPILEQVATENLVKLVSFRRDQLKQNKGGCVKAVRAALGCGVAEALVIIERGRAFEIKHVEAFEEACKEHGVIPTHGNT